MMEWYEALAVLLGTIVFLMAIGMPVALAFLAANIVGAWVFMGGERGITQLLNNGLGSLTKYALMPIPLFLLMGEIFFHTGLGGRMFNAIDKLLGRLPGRLRRRAVTTRRLTSSRASTSSTLLMAVCMASWATCCSLRIAPQRHSLSTRSRSRCNPMTWRRPGTGLPRHNTS